MVEEKGGLGVIKNIFKKHWPLLIILIFFGFLFSILLSSHMLLEKEDGLYSGGSVWGDLALHLSLISSFEERGIVDSLKDFVIYPGETLRYPFLMDLITTGLMKIGLSLRSSLIIPAFLLIIGLLISFYFLVLKITKSRLASFLAPFILLFNGSIFAFKQFWLDFKSSNLSFFQFLFNQNTHYSHLEDQGIHFSNLINDFLLPQRSIILGLFLGVLIINFLWNYLNDSQIYTNWWDKKRKNLLIAGILFGFLPLVHTHTFLSFSIAIFFLGIIDLVNNFKSWKKIILNWLFFLIPAFVLSLPQFLLLFPFGRESFFKFNWGWMKKDETLLTLWIKNLGVHFFFLIFGFFFAKKNLKYLFWAFFPLFILVNFFLFQPNPWDNTKLLIWFYLVMVIIISLGLSKIWQKWKKKSIFLLIPILLLLTSIGGISVIRETTLLSNLFDKNSVDLAKYIKSNTDKNSLFLTSNDHNHPVSCLGGRKILLGFRGWLWSYGLDITDRLVDVLTINQGHPKSLKLIEEYNIDYIVLDRYKMGEWKMNEEFFKENFQIFYQNPRYLVFQVI